MVEIARFPRTPHRARATALAVTVALTGAALAGCSSGGPQTVVTPATTQDSGSASPAGSSTGASAAPSVAPSVTKSGAAGGRPCDPAQLTLALRVHRASQSTAVLTLTNTGGAPCRLTGFPGVDLTGPNDPTFGATYQVPRQGVDFTTVTVEPGGAAHAVLTFLSPVTGEANPWTPTRLVLTPPDTSRQLSVAWTGPAVLRQDAATHPGTYIGPIVAGPGA